MLSEARRGGEVQGAKDVAKSRAWARVKARGRKALRQGAGQSARDKGQGPRAIGTEASGKARGKISGNCNCKARMGSTCDRHGDLSIREKWRKYFAVLVGKSHIQLGLYLLFLCDAPFTSNWVR